MNLPTIEVWSDKGLDQNSQVIRHKVGKKMYRVSTEDAFVDVTEDHPC